MLATKRNRVRTIISLVLILALVIAYMRLRDKKKEQELHANSRNTIQLRDANRNTQTGIPRIIHFIWNNETLPTQFVDNMKGFLRNNPPSRWDYYFWTKEAALQFIKDKYSFLYQRISTEEGSSNFVRADVLRLLVVHEYGGFYFDLDTVSVQPLDGYADTHQCSLSKEPGEHNFIWNMDLLITNAALVCVPFHPFYKLVISKLLEQGSQKCDNAFFCTGPAFLSGLYRAENQTLENRTRLPDLQSSEVFQDVYDVGIANGYVAHNCLNKTFLANLSPIKTDLCDNWIARGMNKRNLSSRAMTYHTWFHTNMYPVSFSKENAIFNIVPQVKIYGQNLHK